MNAIHQDHESKIFVNLEFTIKATTVHVSLVFNLVFEKAVTPFGKKSPSVKTKIYCPVLENYTIAKWGKHLLAQKRLHLQSAMYRQNRPLFL